MAPTTTNDVDRVIRRRKAYENNKPAEWMAALKEACGVYLIHDGNKKVVYVGMSNTKRLKKTIIRHFQHWIGPGSGPTFTKNHLITVFVTNAATAPKLEKRLIKRHQPPLNIDGKFNEEPPF